jgi:hypothetical protein
VTFGDDEHLYDSLDEMEGRTPASLKCFLIQGVTPIPSRIFAFPFTVP